MEFLWLETIAKMCLSVSFLGLVRHNPLLSFSFFTNAMGTKTHICTPERKSQINQVGIHYATPTVKTDYGMFVIVGIAESGDPQSLYAQ